MPLSEEISEYFSKKQVYYKKLNFCGFDGLIIMEETPEIIDKILKEFENEFPDVNTFESFEQEILNNNQQKLGIAYVLMNNHKSEEIKKTSKELDFTAVRLRGACKYLLWTENTERYREFSEILMDEFKGIEPLI